MTYKLDSIMQNIRNFSLFILFHFVLITNVYSQCINGNCYSGKGTYRWSDGSSYEGYWLFGSMHGEGTIIFANGNTYSGTWKMGVKHGNGSFNWNGGVSYIGEWFGDNMSGLGSKKYSNGNIKYGEWIVGNIYESKDNSSVCKSGNCNNGNGIINFPSGDIYEGEFVNGNFSGVGTYKYASGNSYRGDWFKSTMHGNGELKFVNGDFYRGDFLFGVKHGFGYYYWSDDKSWYQGNWFGGKRSGIGTKKDNSGEYEGLWINGNLIKKIPNYSSNISDLTELVAINEKKREIFKKINNGEFSLYDLSMSFYEFGNILMNKKIFNEALELFNYSIEIFNGNALALLSRANIYKQLGDEYNACNDYQKINKVLGERRIIEGFYNYNGEFNSNGFRNGTGTMTYCDGYVQKGLWVNGTFIGEWKYVDNRHKCYYCNSKFSISRKLNSDELKAALNSNILKKNNLVNLYYCESYCSIICKNKSLNESKLLISKTAKQFENSQNLDRTNSSNSSQIRYKPCDVCNLSSTGEQVKQFVYDFDCYRRENTNGRYFWRPGYRICSACFGYGIKTGSYDCGDVCNICKGDRFYPCNNCDGKSNKQY
jgi:hypothetical protein